MICLLDAAGDVVPETNAVIQVEGQDEPPVWREADVRDSRVVFVDQGAETLTG